MLIGVPAFRHADEDISVIVEAVTQRGEYYDDTGDYTDYSSDDTLNIQHQNFYNCSSYKKGSLIQFNKTAELLIYDTYNENILENIKGVSQLSLANESIERPILKTKSNTNAEQETIRARHCDDVTVEDFIAFFESHERKRMKSEPMLSEVRQKQIAKYYNRND